MQLKLAKDSSEGIYKLNKQLLCSCTINGPPCAYVYIKAIETGMIILIMDIKKYFYVFFQRPINFGA